MLYSARWQRSSVVEQRTHKPLVVGSNPSAATKVAVLPDAEELPLKEILGSFPPTPETGKQFLSQFANRKTATLARYVATLKGFFAWYGEKLNMTVKLPKQLPGCHYALPCHLAILGSVNKSSFC